MTRFNSFLGLALLCSPILAAAQANISNGTVRIGVRADGALMPRSVAPITGITYLPTGADGLTPGCLCEAWGIADATSSQSGHTGTEVGTSNITTESFASNATSATSVTNAFGTFRVTHSFNPSSGTANLFEVKVTIQNISAASTRVLYGRAMDFDVFPTEFDELVTLQRGTSAVVYSSDDGFYNANPLGTDNPILFSNQDVVDSGPTDHGAHFRFDLGTLAPGASLEFTIGYGAAGSTAEATAALSAFRAEAYSLGKPSSSNDGTPNTFIFAFRGVGGTQIIDTFTTCAAEGYTGTKLILCRQICETNQTPSRLTGLIRIWMGAYRSEPPCAR